MPLCLEGFRSWIHAAKACGVEPERPFGDIKMATFASTIANVAWVQTQEKQKAGEKKEAIRKTKWKSAVWLAGFCKEVLWRFLILGIRTFVY